MFRDRIKSAYDDLSPSFQRVADYLMDHPYEAAFMTATQLGRRLDVDTATVVRFAQRLEYPGFPELLDEVRQEVRSQLVRYFQPVESGGNNVDLFRAAVRQDMRNIEQLDLTLSPVTIERIVAMINAARRIWVVGDGTLSRPAAQMLANALSSSGYGAASLPTDTATVATAFQTLDEKDVVIAIAVTSYCPDTTSILELAHERGAGTIALVGAQSWPIVRAADVAMQCAYVGASKSASASAFCVAISAITQMLFAGRRQDIVAQYVDFERAMHALTESRSRFEFSKPEWVQENDGQE